MNVSRRTIQDNIQSCPVQEGFKLKRFSNSRSFQSKRLLAITTMDPILVFFVPTTV
jgi:hypothetical protein